MQLSASFDSEQQVVRLKWNDYSDRLKYRVERSEEGGNWQAIGETTSGSYTDGSIVLPKSADDPLGQIFGGKKTYQYRVIAVDTVENKEAGPSNTAKIQLVSEQRPLRIREMRKGMTHPGMSRGITRESRKSRLRLHPAMMKENHSPFPTGEIGDPGDRRFGAGEEIPTVWG